MAVTAPDTSKLSRTPAGRLSQVETGLVRVAGWVHSVRDLGRVGFLTLRDPTGLCQVVFEDESTKQLKGLFAETVIDVVGEALAEEKAPGGFEIRNPVLRVLSQSVEELPIVINKKRLDVRLDTLLNYSALALRHPSRGAVFRLTAECMKAFRHCLDDLGFTEITTPKIVESATEGGAELFSVDYFDRKAFLAQSPQLYKQAMVGVFERVYEIAPVFRAEPHATARHLSEYVSMDVELGFIEDHHDVMEVLSCVVRSIITHLRETGCGDDICKDPLPAVPDKIPWIQFRDAQEILEVKYEEPCRGEDDLSPKHERLLCEWGKEEHDSEFLYVTGFPMSKRPFYTHPAPGDPDSTNGFDLLFRGLELVTGGQRLHRHEDYLESLQRRGIDDVSSLEGYLQIFNFGMPPHGGFAIGLERLVMQLTGAKNIRETTLFPRDMSRLSP